jgi:hypothetical protein
MSGPGRQTLCKPRYAEIGLCDSRAVAGEWR